MLPTPDLAHLTAKDYGIVYEPAGEILKNSFLNCPSDLILEDTFLLLDALEADANDLKTLRPAVCLEIGRVIL